MTARPGDPMVTFVDQVLKLSATRVISYITISPIYIAQKARPLINNEEIYLIVRQTSFFDNYER